MPAYLHKEAFCLMKYRNDAGTIVEWIWNSRDGVTPFLVAPRGAQRPIDNAQFLRHVDWEFDIRIPHYVPGPGERYFADFTMRDATAWAEELVARGWDDPEHPLSKAFPTKEEAVAKLAKDEYGDGRQPTLRDGPMPAPPPESGRMVPWTPKKFA